MFRGNPVNNAIFLDWRVAALLAMTMFYYASLAMTINQFLFFSFIFLVVFSLMALEPK
jgi:hypothetical protein